MFHLKLKSEKDFKNNILVPRAERVSRYLSDLDSIQAFFYVLTLH